MSGCFHRLAMAGLLWTAFGLSGSAQPLPMFKFESADFILSDSVRPPDDGAAWQPVRLPDDWHNSRPGVTGVGWYRFALALPAGPRGMYSIYIPRRTARRISFFVNGALIGVGFIRGDARVLNFDAPQRFAVPPTLLRPGANVLHIMVDGSADLRQGLSRVTVGPGGLTFPTFSRRVALQVDSRWAFGGAALLAGSIALAFWVRRRGDTVMFWFSAAALTWALMSVPWSDAEFGELGFANDLLNFPLRFAYAAPLFVLCLRVANRRAPKGESAIWLFTIAGAVLTPFVDESSRGVILTIWSVAYLIVLSLLLALLLNTQAAKGGVAGLAMLAAVLAGVTVLNLCDLGRWMGWLDYDSLTLTYFHVPLVLFAIGVTIVDRHFIAVAAVERSKIDLEAQVLQKTREIEASYQQLREAERGRVQTLERGRIMADMHDGVGASLLSLLSMVQSGKAEPPAIERRVWEALLELRLVVDSLSPVDGDLAVVLGNVRHRMREPIEDSGVRFVWQVAELPPVDYLTPRAILAIQRIVLEAIANALQHARARTITVRTRVDGQGLLIQVIDDGIGFDPAKAWRGRGLANLHNRARSIGAEVEIDTSTQPGTSVTLRLPFSLSRDQPEFSAERNPPTDGRRHRPPRR
jgi:signal transduction histidine kinase